MLLKVPLVFNIPQEVTLDDSQMMFGHVFLYILPSCDSPGLFFPTTLCVALLLNCVSPAMLSIVPRHRAKLRFPGDVWLRFPTTSRWSAIPRPLCPADLQFRAMLGVIFPNDILKSIMLHSDFLVLSLKCHAFWSYATLLSPPRVQLWWWGIAGW